MNERLLQYIWQFQHFNKVDLRTTNGEALQVIFPGHINFNQGPDFLDAKLILDRTTWAGSVELHLEAGDWMKHGHDNDENYRNVILHVVWRNNGSVEGERFPVLELAPLVPKILLERYEILMDLSSFIPCQSSLMEVKDITWHSWKERLLVERMSRKAFAIENFQKQNNFHWEETCWWLMARNFGAHVNSDAFEAMARSIPLNVLGRQKKNIIELEALIFGQAGLLNGRYQEAYPKMLQKEYRYQRNKHKLRPILIPVHFLRMRPGNFPTIRLAQLAMLVNKTEHLFSLVKETNDLSNLRSAFDVVANDYWHYHYRFDEESPFKIKKLGAAMIDSLVMNTIVPLLFAYGNYYKEFHYKEKAMDWLEQLDEEENRITRSFEKLGLVIKNAWDSQALLELKTGYCDLRRCLDCAIGNAILVPNSILPNPPLHQHPGEGLIEQDS